MLIKGLRPQGALGFPRGEAVAQIGSSEPIWVTDEERRALEFTHAREKNAPNSD